MTFLGILLTLFIIFYLGGYLLRAFLPRLLMWLFQRRVRKQMENAFGQAPRSEKKTAGNPFGWPFGFSEQTRQKPPRHHRKGKIFSRDVGEYVEFEEISCDVQTRASDSSSVKFKPESQVSDAQWEDL